MSPRQLEQLLQQDTVLDFEPVVEGPGGGCELHTAMCLGELWWVLLLSCPMSVFCSGTCSGHLCRQDRWEDIVSQKEFLMFVCCL